MSGGLRLKLQLFVHRNRVGIVAVLVMFCSIFYSGLIKTVGARDIDARYFYVAARCWASGESPYDAGLYRARYRDTFGVAPDGLFAAYLPTLLPAILPMAPLSWPAAARLFAALNFSAAMILLWATYKLMRELLGAPLRLMHWFWLTLGITIGGAAATISTGQTSLLITAACACALLGCRLQSRWLVVAGAVIASAKPSLSAPILLFILMFEPAQRKPMFLAGGIITAFMAFAAALDGNIVSHYLGGISAYDAIPNNDPRTQIGLGAFLASMELSPFLIKVLSLVVLMTSLTLAGLLCRSGKPDGRANAPLALTLVFFSVGVIHAIHAYDLCIYATGISLCALLPRRLQFTYLVPALCLWRPTVLDKVTPLSADTISNLGWVFLLTFGLFYSAATLWKGRSNATD